MSWINPSEPSGALRMPSWHRAGQARILCRHRSASDSSDDLGLSDTADREPGRHYAGRRGAPSLTKPLWVPPPAGGGTPRIVKSLAPRASPHHTIGIGGS